MVNSTIESSAAPDSAAPMTAGPSRFDVAPEITHSRFQRALLGVMHDKATVEQRPWFVYLVIAGCSAFNALLACGCLRYSRPQPSLIVEPEVAPVHVQANVGADAACGVPGDRERHGERADADS